MDRVRLSVRFRRRRSAATMDVAEDTEVAVVPEVVDSDRLRAVLDRDQRTVRTAELRTFRNGAHPYRHRHQSVVVVCDQCCVRTPTTTSSSPCCRHPEQQRTCPPRIRPATKSSSARSSAWFPAGSAIRWLVVVVCVFALLPTRTMAAPASRSPFSQPRPKWINPCGMNNKEVEQELEELSVPSLTVSELMQQIVVQAKNALMHANLFRDEYVKRTFNVGFEQHHEAWKGVPSYDWLPKVPKDLGETAAEEHLQKQKLEEALKNTYQDLQKYAVGLEQMVWDEEEGNGDFTETFKAMEFKLRSVLCEVQVAMAEQGVLQHPDVTREIMGKDLREMTNETYRHLRDWIVLRDYMNGLEYVIQLFEHFHRHQGGQVQTS